MLKSRNNFFKIKTLDAAEMLLARKKNDLVIKSDGNFKIRFRYNLSGEDSTGRRIILREEMCPDNALFWQILNLLPPSNIPDEEKLREALVFIDFKKTFRKQLAPQAQEKTTASSEELLRDDRAALISLFDSGDGIELSFDGVNYKTFVPFDRSSNMARHCVISFVESSLEEQLNKSLMLDMNFANVPLVLSKYYAYRGLYLSTARRIESFGETDTALLLNQETVIVLPDFYTNVWQKIFTAKERDGLWESETQEKFLNLNSFDGEGLICPQYADKINSQLNMTAHSFQIRLPFTKGVLHEVDFAKFFIEELGLQGSELLIEDLFGNKRDLLKAKVILTASMFKCGGWMEKFAKTVEDPMRFFFEKMREYDHALYVANMDAGLTNTGKIRLNYQFLSTLKLTAQEFDSLVEEQIQKIKSIPDNYGRLLNLDSFDDFEEDFDEKPPVDELRDKCLKILARNDAFLKNAKIKTLLQKVQEDYEKELCLGKFSVQGEVRFLSCDLLAFLLNIAKRTEYFGRDDQRVRELARQTLYHNRFYMPEQKLRMKSDKCYVLLRNPHLSRNEQCLLQPYVKAGGLYEKYFSHLNGMLMISCRSAVAAALGGADFDGDLVKVISDRRIVEAVKRTSFTFNGKFFERVLPVIEIPAGKAERENIPKRIPFRVVENTFSNKIGLISNLAVKLAQKEYSTSSEEPPEGYVNKCAECTIVVGLEIDAAKNGVHPNKNIEKLQALADAKKTGEKNLFLDAKKFLAKLSESGWHTPTVIKSDKSFDFYLTKEDALKNKAAFSAPISIDGAGASIEFLPLRYLDFKAQNFKLELKPQGEIYFDFEKVPTWRKDLEAEKCADLRKLVQGFTAIRHLAHKVDSLRKWLAARNFDSFAEMLLRVQYDNPCSELSCGVQIFEAVEQARATLTTALRTLSDVEGALKLLREMEWHYTPKTYRAENLARILNVELLSIPPAVVELLSTFRDNGYMILFYLLNELRFDLKNNMDNAEFIGASEKLRQLTLTDNRYWKELYDEYCRADSEKLSVTARDKILTAICRRHVEEIFAGEMEMALKSFWSLRSEDNGGNFFWNVFETNEILKNLPKEGGENHVE